MENWKKVEWIDGDYMISDMGNLVNVKTGKRVGMKTRGDYMRFNCKVNGKIKNIALHQLVWEAFGGGMWSKDIVIDHINNDKSDNRIKNLQLISFRGNVVKDTKIGRSGVVGVSWNTQKQRWLGQISINDVRYNLGYKKTVGEAKQLYDEALENFEKYGILPTDSKEILPDDKKRCTRCNEVLDVTKFDFYKTCRGNISRRAMCMPCYKEFRRINDKKYRSKIA
jgi:hypothetical protein